jgi:hypothetical protein
MPGMRLWSLAALVLTILLGIMVPVSVYGSQSHSQWLNESQEIEQNTPTVTVRNANVNIRRGPALNYQVIATAPSGTTFEVLGVSADGGWWLICCVQQGSTSASTHSLRGWVSSTVVTANVAAQSVDVVLALLPDDLSARWTVDYTCSSDRCEVPACSGESTAGVERNEDRIWLQVKHDVVWDEACGENSSWERIVDRFTGQDWFGADSEDVVSYWMGMKPGAANGLYSMSRDQQIIVWCKAIQEEVNEGNGWIVGYTGTACYDQKSGVLTNVTYVKRWFFTGTFEEDQYLKAYFGDQESYHLRLEETNIPLRKLDLSWLRFSQQ